jgi:NADPH:quinone reductase
LDTAFVFGSGIALEEYLQLVRQGGRIAFPYGVTPEPRERSGISVNGYDLKAGPSELTRMTQLSTKAHLRVPIAATYSLDEAAKAHQRLQEGHVLGRIVLGLKLTS